MPTNKTIASYATSGPKQPLKPFSYEPASLGPWDIEVTITHCGICHSDLHLINNEWNNSQYPLIPGHEIIGTIAAKGDAVAHLAIGQRVGIGWQCKSCQTCEWCHSGQENLCLRQEATCLGHYGGFAQAIRVDSRFAFLIPESLASENAAPLLCGGATVFSPLVEHKVDARTRVGVIGIGGLGHLAIQFAHAYGCEVTALSSSPEKEKEAQTLGADHFLPSLDPKALAAAAGSLDFVISAAIGELPWPTYLSLLRPKGKLCLVGVPANQISVEAFDLLSARKTLCGSNIASPLVIQEMLNFAAHHNIVAQTELFPISDVNQALEKLTKNQIHYRAVLTCAPWS